MPTDGACNEDSLEHELCLSATMFASLHVDEIETHEKTEDICDDGVMVPQN